MKKRDFEQLVESIKQAGKIKRGKLKPSRTFEFKPAEIKSVREKLGVSQSEFALMIGISVSTRQNWEQVDGSRRGRLEPFSKLLPRIRRQLPMLSARDSQEPDNHELEWTAPRLRIRTRQVVGLPDSVASYLRLHSTHVGRHPPVIEQQIHTSVS